MSSSTVFLKGKNEEQNEKRFSESPFSKPSYDLHIMRRPLRRCDGSPCEHAPCDLRPVAAFSAGRKANKFAKKRIEAEEIELKRRKKEIT